MVIEGHKKGLKGDQKKMSQEEMDKEIEEI